MIPGTSDSSLSQLAGVFFQYGPFFLAIFLPLVILSTARGWYNEANVRQNPPASQKELDTYRLYFLCSVGCSVIVVFLSLVVWWLLNIGRRENTFQFAILDLPQNEVVDSTDYYSRETQAVTATGVVVHTHYFVVDQDQPFKEGQQFNFDFYALPARLPSFTPLGTASTPLTVVYHRDARQNMYRVVRGPRGPQLIRDGDTTVKAGATNTIHLANREAGGD